jgi:hypothetical protein
MAKSKPSFEAHYVASAEPQQLEVHFRLAAKRRAHVHPLHEPRLFASYWADLVNAGLAAGDRFDPTASRARVIEELAPMKKTGVHPQRLVLEVAGVAGAKCVKSGR